eukprot:3424082-Prymnesium_polylepis.1
MMTRLTSKKRPSNQLTQDSQYMIFLRSEYLPYSVSFDIPKLRNSLGFLHTRSCRLVSETQTLSGRGVDCGVACGEWAWCGVAGSARPEVYSVGARGSRRLGREHAQGCAQCWCRKGHAQEGCIAGKGCGQVCRRTASRWRITVR